MKTTISIEDLTTYVKENIGAFHSSRLQRLRDLRLHEILKKKNPYLFKAKNMLLAQDLVQAILDAYLSSQEEGIFGNFLEGLAIFVNQRAYGGWKSSAKGIDLEFDKGGVRHIVLIKSGPNWANSSQVAKMKADFTSAAKTLRTSGTKMQIVPVNGCCYGRDNNPDKGDYYKYCGQRFWEFISGNEELYVQIIKPLGHDARRKNAEYYREYARIVNSFTTEFSSQFVKDGQIDWDALVRFNSSTTRPPTKRKKS